MENESAFYKAALLTVGYFLSFKLIENQYFKF